MRVKYFDPAGMSASTMLQMGALTDDNALNEVDAVAALLPA
jgi:hypothetical protein